MLKTFLFELQKSKSSSLMTENLQDIKSNIGKSVQKFHTIFLEKFNLQLFE